MSVLIVRCLPMAPSTAPPTRTRFRHVPFEGTVQSQITTLHRRCPDSAGERRRIGQGALVQSPLPRCWPCRDGCVYALPKHAHADYLIRSIGLPDRGLVVHSGAGLSWSAGSPPFLPRMSRVIRV